MGRGIRTFQVDVPFSTSPRMLFMLMWGFTPISIIAIHRERQLQHCHEVERDGAARSTTDSQAGTHEPFHIHPTVSCHVVPHLRKYEAVDDDARITERLSCSHQSATLASR